MDPLTELRAMDELFDRMFGLPHKVGANQPTSGGASTAMLPVDIYEKGDKFFVKAAVPGVKPEDLDIQIDNNVLTIRGELRQQNQEQDAKVYVREYTYGAFSRSIRLPENVNIGQVEAEFNDGFVTIWLPKIEEPKAKALKVPVRTAEPQPETKVIEQHSESKADKKR
jgi:HSP20 family protein